MGEVDGLGKPEVGSPDHNLDRS